MNRHTRAVILLADNSYDYRHSLRGFLELGNFKVEEADSLEAALEKLDTLPFDLVLADLRLTNDDNNHDISGLEVAKQANQLDVPCIIVTAFPTVEAARLALRARGVIPLAEEFVPKDAGPEALLDVINAVLDNTDQAREEGKAPPPGLAIDLGQRLVTLGGEHLDLPRLQYNLLAYLFERRGAVCSPEEIIQAVYGEQLSAAQAAADRRLERLVERVRRKIEPDPSAPRHLIKEYGRGYRLDLSAPASPPP